MTIKHSQSLTLTQRQALIKVCETNGGGVRINCIVRDGEVIPSSLVWRALWNQDLIQGKAGGFERVVHTRKGWELYQQIVANAD